MYVLVGNNVLAFLSLAIGGSKQAFISSCFKVFPVSRVSARLKDDALPVHAEVALQLAHLQIILLSTGTNFKMG